MAVILPTLALGEPILTLYTQFCRLYQRERKFWMLALK